jgi:hypothetical protein
MKGKTIEAVLCFVVVLSLIVTGLTILRDNREIGPIEPDYLRHTSMSTLGCDWFCQIVVGLLIQYGIQYAAGQVQNNSCNGPCGGGGGGGFGSDGCELDSSEICHRTDVQ